MPSIHLFPEALAAFILSFLTARVSFAFMPGKLSKMSLILHPVSTCRLHCLCRTFARRRASSTACGGTRRLLDHFDRARCCVNAMWFDSTAPSCSRCRMMTHDNGLWKSLCVVNEKGPAMPEKPVFPWEVLYMGNPHVPNDFKKIGQAAIFARQSSCK